MPIDAPSAAEYAVWNNSGIIAPGQAIAPVRNGMDRRSGAMLTGWEHVLQSIYTLFATRYHERILREYVGSFVGHLLGKNITDTTITRFFWAIATGISLWEPDYKVTRVLVNTDASTGDALAVPTTAESIREGEISLVTQGIYYPRGHLGDFTPGGLKTSAILGRGGGRWSVS